MIQTQSFFVCCEKEQERKDNEMKIIQTFKTQQQNFIQFQN
jgi:hypothetical protein